LRIQSSIRKSWRNLTHYPLFRTFYYNIYIFVNISLYVFVFKLLLCILRKNIHSINLNFEMSNSNKRETWVTTRDVPNNNNVQINNKLTLETANVGENSDKSREEMEASVIAALKEACFYMKTKIHSLLHSPETTNNMISSGFICNNKRLLPISQPSLIPTSEQLFSHQIEGLQFLSILYHNYASCILADEMGLGKTATSLALIAQLAENYFEDVSPIPTAAGEPFDIHLAKSGLAKLGLQLAPLPSQKIIQNKKRITGPSLNSTPMETRSDSYSSVRGSLGTHLIVVPTSTLENWTREIARWCPFMSVLVYAGNVNERKEAQKVLLTSFCNIVLCPMSILEKGDKESKFIVSKKWHLVIIDEAHGLKNTMSRRFSIVLSLKCRMRLLLTGTPVQNGVAELCALLQFVQPDFFVQMESKGIQKKYIDFIANEDDEYRDEDEKESFNNPIFRAIESEIRKVGNSGKRNKSDNNKNFLSDALSCFILRRTKQSVNLNLPEKKLFNHWYSMTVTQRSIAKTLYGICLILAKTESSLSLALQIAMKNEGNEPTYLDNCENTQVSCDQDNCENTVSQLLGSPVFIGDLQKIFSQKSENEIEIKGNILSSFIMLLRKIAIHPLLLRTRYTNEVLIKLAHDMIILDHGKSIENSRRKSMSPELMHLSVTQPFTPTSLMNSYQPFLKSASLSDSKIDKHSEKMISFLQSLSDFQIMQEIESYGSRLKNYLLPDECIMDSCKIKALLALVADITACNSRALVFSQVSISLCVRFPFRSYIHIFPCSLLRL
jgi:SNF2 family DNA or RNA helicase